MPPQQSAPLEHTSPVWMQYDEARTHVPALHSVEQQSPSAAQGFPAVLHDVLRAWHVPPEQFPPQQSAFAAQAALSAIHEAPHFPPLQAKLQQAVGDVHEAPSAAH